MHMDRIYRDDTPPRPALTAHQLVERMDREGIEIGVLLPLESPEGSWGYFLTEEAVAARDLYPERLIAFVCVDPRYPRVEQFIRYFVEERGCRGFGEHVNGLPFDDPLNKRIYACCADLGLPLLFEIDRHYCADEEGLPRLETCLKEFREVTFVGHGPAFWSAFSADDPRGTYPPGPVRPVGAVDRLLAEHDNLYADLSAGSGYNAMTREVEGAPGACRLEGQRVNGSMVALRQVSGRRRPNRSLSWFCCLLSRSSSAPAALRLAIGRSGAGRRATPSRPKCP